MYRVSDFTKPAYKPGEVAAILDVTVKTIQNYDKEGRLRVHRSPTNRRVIMRDDLLAYLDAQGVLIDDTGPDRQDVIYVRIPDINNTGPSQDAQALSVMERVRDLHRPTVLKDIGSGLDETRPGYRELLKLVRAGQVRHVCVISENILSESGFHTLQTMFAGFGTDIIITG